MIRALALACLALLAACGGSTGATTGGAAGPPSAESVAANSSDFPGLQKCPESGSYETYLTAEHAKSPTLYANDTKNWEQLQAAGADDSYIVVYADSAADCGQYSGNRTGKVAIVLAVRFKDSASAAAAYGTEQNTFRLSASQIATLKAIGATVQQGSQTGFGDNSITVAFSQAAVSIYIAVWQHKEFAAAVATNNLPTATGAAEATKVNARIR